MMSREKENQQIITKLQEYSQDLENMLGESLKLND